jgi:hypothetical protein
LLVGFLPANAYFALRVVRMTMHVNKEQVNDAAKLMIHRLIARELGCGLRLSKKRRSRSIVVRSISMATHLLESGLNSFISLLRICVVV